MDPAEKPSVKSASDLTATPRPRLHRRRAIRRKREWRFQTGKVLGTSISVWWARLIPFSVLTVIVFSPYIALQVWGNVTTSSAGEAWWPTVTWLLHLLMAHVVTATR